MNDKNINNSVGGNNYGLNFTPGSSYLTGGTIQTSVPYAANQANNFSNQVDEIDLSLTSDVETIEDSTSPWKEYVEEQKKVIEDEKAKLQNENESLKNNYQEYLANINLSPENLASVIALQNELNNFQSSVYNATSPYAPGIEARVSSLQKQISEEYEKVKLKYINEHPDEFKSVMGMSFDEYNQKIADNEQAISELDIAIYDLKQAAKEMPYLEMMLTEEFFNYASTHSEASAQSMNYLENRNLEGYLTEDQLMMFSYLYDTKGWQEAYKYLNAIEDKINHAKGLAEALEFFDSITDENGNVDVSKVESSLRSLGVGFVDGLATFGEGIYHVFDVTDDGTKTALDYKKEFMVMGYEMLQGKGELPTYVDNVYSFGSSVGEYLPVALASCASPGLGTALLSTSQAGHSKHKVLVEGKTDSILEAYGYGAWTATQTIVIDKFILGKMEFFDSKNFYTKVLEDGTTNALVSVSDNLSESLFLGEEFNLGEVSLEALEKFAAGCVAKGMALTSDEAFKFLKNTIVKFSTGGQEYESTLDEFLKNENKNANAKLLNGLDEAIENDDYVAASKIAASLDTKSPQIKLPTNVEKSLKDLYKKVKKNAKKESKTVLGEVFFSSDPEDISSDEEALDDNLDTADDDLDTDYDDSDTYDVYNV